MLCIKCDVKDFVKKIKNALKKADSDDQKVVENVFQSIYNDFVNYLIYQADILQASNYLFESISVHAYYFRDLYICGYRIKVKITRVRTDDGHTHAILLSFMIPYSLRETHDYVCAFEGGDLSDAGNILDKTDRTYLRWQFNNEWKPVFQISGTPIKELSLLCLRYISMQMMQNRRICCRLLEF